MNVLILLSLAYHLIHWETIIESPYFRWWTRIWRVWIKEDTIAVQSGSITGYFKMSGKAYCNPERPDTFGMTESISYAYITKPCVRLCNFSPLPWPNNWFPALLSRGAARQIRALHVKLFSVPSSRPLISQNWITQEIWGLMNTVHHIRKVHNMYISGKTIFHLTNVI